jgi:hypothetical protein
LELPTTSRDRILAEPGTVPTNDLASELTTKIQAFEDWFGALPRRVETDWDGEQYPDGCWLVLRFHRAGKRWIFSFVHCDPNSAGDDESWTPLTDGSIETTLEAITTFPQVVAGDVGGAGVAEAAARGS